MENSKEMEDLFLMQQAYATLFVTVNKIQARGDSCFNNITSRQFMLMIAILHLDEDETTLNNIASKLGTSKQNVNTLVNGMAKKGYLEIVPSSRDKRAVNVKLTEKAREEISNNSEASINFLLDIFNDFKTEEIKVLWKLLKKLYEYDGAVQDGFEEKVESKTSGKNVDKIMENIHQKRKDK